MDGPAPRAARDVVSKGESRDFVVQALDPPRRGIELALPEFANPSGVPSDETVEQEIKRSGDSFRKNTSDLLSSCKTFRAHRRLSEDAAASSGSSLTIEAP